MQYAVGDRVEVQPGDGVWRPGRVVSVRGGAVRVVCGATPDHEYVMEADGRYIRPAAGSDAKPLGPPDDLECPKCSGQLREHGEVRVHYGRCGCSIVPTTRQAWIEITESPYPDDRYAADWPWLEVDGPNDAAERMWIAEGFGEEEPGPTEEVAIAAWRAALARTQAEDDDATQGEEVSPAPAAPAEQPSRLWWSNAPTAQLTYETFCKSIADALACRPSGWTVSYDENGRAYYSIKTSPGDAYRLGLDGLIAFEPVTTPSGTVVSHRMTPVNVSMLDAALRDAPARELVDVFARFATHVPDKIGDALSRVGPHWSSAAKHRGAWRIEVRCDNGYECTAWMVDTTGEEVGAGFLLTRADLRAALRLLVDWCNA